MPRYLYPIAVFLSMIISSLVARILAALGLGIVTYKMINSGVDALEAQINQSFSGVGPDMLAIIKMAGFSEFASLIFSAWSAVIAIRLVAGSLKRITFIPSSGD